MIIFTPCAHSYIEYLKYVIVYETASRLSRQNKRLGCLNSLVATL